MIMRLKIASIIIFFLIFYPNRLPAEVLVKETQGLKYHLFIPSLYNQSKTYPLIIALHESTGKGLLMIDRFKEQAEKKGYIVAAPDSAESMLWGFCESEDIFRMMDEIKSEYNIDNGKILVTGFSAGAIFSLYLGLSFPHKFTAVAAYSGHIRDLGGSAVLSHNPQNHIPFFILHGNRDNQLDVSEGRYAYQQLSHYGYPVKFREISGLGHRYTEQVSWIIVNWFEKIKKGNQK